MFDKFHEGPLLADLSEEEHRSLRLRIAQTNLGLARVLGVLSLVFVGLLAWLNLVRLERGLFAGGGTYVLLLLAHLAFAISLLPLVLLWRKPEAKAMESPLLDAYMLGFCMSIMGMGILGILERGSLVLTGIGLLAANLLFTLPLRLRLIFNATTFLAGGALIFISWDGSGLTLLIRSAELLALIFTCGLAGSLQNRQRVSSILSELRLERLAMLDALTGVASRRRIELVLAAELSRVRSGVPLSVVILDVDHFKSVNDTFGHDTGDGVLQGVARLMLQRTRLQDLVGRWGGEEFLVICAETAQNDAAELAERLRSGLESHRFPQVGVKTASFGVAQARLGDDPRDLFERADKALYQAKRSGRNRVIVGESLV